MIDYNPKEWISTIFSLHKGDTARRLLPAVVIVSLYAWAVAFLILEYLAVTSSSDLKNVSLVHSLLGFVISMLLVFRTNTAYDRWWEGRKQWGTLMNASRNFALRLNNILSEKDEEEREYFQKMIPNYAFALKNHLRRINPLVEYENIESFPIAPIKESEHIPNHLANLLNKKLFELYKTQKIDDVQLRILDQELSQFTNVCGACERIKNTPIPYSYSSFIKKFIMIYCLTLPVGYVFNMHYLVVPFVAFVFYVLMSLEVIAEEIENPFGDDNNDLPLDRICTNIRKSVADIFENK